MWMWKLASEAGHCFYNTDESADKAVTEAREFGKSHPSWKFWMCCCCGKKFVRSDLLFKHLANTHFTSQAKSTICLWYQIPS